MKKDLEKVAISICMLLSLLCLYNLITADISPLYVAATVLSAAAVTALGYTKKAGKTMAFGSGRALLLITAATLSLQSGEKLFINGVHAFIWCGILIFTLYRVYQIYEYQKGKIKNTAHGWKIKVDVIIDLILVIMTSTISLYFMACLEPTVVGILISINFVLVMYINHLTYSPSVKEINFHIDI